MENKYSNLGLIDFLSLLYQAEQYEEVFKDVLSVNGIINGVVKYVNTSVENSELISKYNLVVDYSKIYEVETNDLIQFDITFKSQDSTLNLDISSQRLDN